MTEYHYYFEMTMDTSEALSTEDLTELGIELIHSSEGFMKAKRKKIRVRGGIDIGELRRV